MMINNEAPKARHFRWTPPFGKLAVLSRVAMIDDEAHQMSFFGINYILCDLGETDHSCWHCGNAVVVAHSAQKGRAPT